MRIWDIIDRVEPGIEITEINEKPVSVAPGGVRFTLTIAAGLILAAGSTFAINVTPRDRRPPVVAGADRKPIVAARGASAGFQADTRHAMSASKLAQAFSTLFEPAEEEPILEGKYFFG